MSYQIFIRLRPETTDVSPWRKAKVAHMTLRRMFALIWKRRMNNWKGTTAFKPWGSILKHAQKELAKLPARDYEHVRDSIRNLSSTSPPDRMP